MENLRTLAVRKFSKCGRPSDIYNLQEIDATAVVEACGQALSETALEDLQLSPALLQQLAGKPAAAKKDWRQLWQA